MTGATDERETWYDYQLQVWVVDGVIQSCDHPKPCPCHQAALAGRRMTVRDGVITMEAAMKVS